MRFGSSWHCIVRCGCDSDTDSNRAMPTARRNVKNTNIAKHRPIFLPPILLVGSEDLVLKVPKRGQFHAAIRVTRKRCDSCAQVALLAPDGIAAKLLRCGIASEALRRNMPLSFGCFQFQQTELGQGLTACRSCDVGSHATSGGGRDRMHHVSARHKRAWIGKALAPYRIGKQDQESQNN